jgi:geranylgeranyl diphosphate synthase type I
MRVTLAAGQFLDLVESGRPVSKERARRIAFLKSGEYTVEGPLHIGAILGGASEQVISALSRYGRPLGEAFQVRDDLAAAIRGESDLAQGRPTFVLAAARDRANEKDRRFLQDHVGGADLTPSQRGELREILHRSGAVEEADRLVSHLVDEAMGALEDAHLPPEAARALRALGALIAGTTT